MLKDEMTKWAEDGAELGALSWRDLPEIPLYMDQVVSLLGDKLKFYQRDDDTKLLTSSMINNYVKSAVIPHPEKKKYSKDQLASLVVVCMLKQVLSIPDIKTLVSECEDRQSFYENFENSQTQAMNDVSEQVRFAVENGDDLKLLALKFAAQANAQRAAAEKILIEIEKENNEPKSKSKKK